jgi:uncharacterized OsmC-like protein
MENKKRDLKDIVESRKGLFTRKPEAAKYYPKVSSRHMENLWTETDVRDHTITSDYGEPAGGTNKAPNPIELLLTAFAACVEAAIYEFAVHEGYKIDSMTVDVGGELDLRGMFMIGDVKSGFETLEYTVNIETPDNKDEVLALAQRVINKCPVVDSLSNPINIVGDIKVN